MDSRRPPARLSPWLSAAAHSHFAYYIAQKTDASTVRYTVPDAVTAPGQNYVMQFARRLAFSGAGNQLTYTRVVSQTYSSATMAALITNVGAGGATTLQTNSHSPTFFAPAPGRARRSRKP